MKRLILPILLLILIIVGLIAGIYVTAQKKSQTNNEVAPSEPSEKLTLSPLQIAFIPNVIKLGSSTDNKIQADITLDSGAQDIAGADIKILCDPKRIKNLTFTQKRDRYSSLSYSFTDTKATINPKNCEAELKLSVPTGSIPSRGSGIVGHVTATVIGNEPTEIVINPTSNGTSNQTGKGFEVMRVNLELTK